MQHASVVGGGAGCQPSSDSQTPASRIQDRLCVDCRYCVWERIDPDGPQVPFCDNLETKNFNHPIGFLHPHSHACELFDQQDRLIPLPILPGPGKPERSAEAGFFRAHQTLLAMAGVVFLILELLKLLKSQIHDLIH